MVPTMSDDPRPLDFSEFAGRTPNARKRKTQGDPEHTISDEAMIREDVAAVVDSKKFKAASVEEIAEIAIRRMANAVILGGDGMLPTSLKEASDAAKIWASVQSMAAAVKNGKGSVHNEDDPSVKAVLSELEAFKKTHKRP